VGHIHSSLSGVPVVRFIYSREAAMATTVNYKRFRDSIKELNTTGNQAIEGTYKGKVRRLWPIVLGFDEKGDEAVLCYQYLIDGAPPDEPLPLKNLRCFKIAIFTGAVTRIDFPNSLNGPEFTPQQVRRQNCIEDVRHYRAVKKDDP
jgi:hypothetical protein